MRKLVSGAWLDALDEVDDRLLVSLSARSSRDGDSAGVGFLEADDLRLDALGGSELPEGC
jgi:hypothetical protein